MSQDKSSDTFTGLIARDLAAQEAERQAEREAAEARDDGPRSPERMLADEEHSAPGMAAPGDRAALGSGGVGGGGGGGARSGTTKLQAGDELYMRDLAEAHLRHGHPLAHLSLLISVGFVAAFLIWAGFATLEEASSGVGQVIPSGQTQVIQSLEGGLLTEMMVREGELVEKGQVLLKIDDTGFAADLRNRQAMLDGLRAEVARLGAEAEGAEPAFPPDLAAAAPEVVDAERRLYRRRRDTLESEMETHRKNLLKARQEKAALDLAVTRLAAEVEGKEPAFPEGLEREYPTLVRAERALYRARARSLAETTASQRRSLELTRKELEMNRPLIESGVVSEVEVLRLERQVNDLEGEIVDAENRYRSKAAQELSEKKPALFRVERQINELTGDLTQVETKFRTAARAQLNEKGNELKRLKESMVSSADRVRRTIVKAPVRGTVKTIHITTIGGVIKPGESIMELTPRDDTLLVEAKIRPSDIAFIHAKQAAKVKITAFDFSIYGALEGTVQHISAGTITDERGQAYYLVRVRTERDYLQAGPKRHPIIPGMVAQVDVITGRKTVLDYLLKPITKARYEALRER